MAGIVNKGKTLLCRLVSANRSVERGGKALQGCSWQGLGFRGGIAKGNVGALESLTLPSLLASVRLVAEESLARSGRQPLICR